MRTEAIHSTLFVKSRRARSDDAEQAMNANDVMAAFSLIAAARELEVRWNAFQLLKPKRVDAPPGFTQTILAEDYRHLDEKPYGDVAICLYANAYQVDEAVPRLLIGNRSMMGHVFVLLGDPPPNDDILMQGITTIPPVIHRKKGGIFESRGIRHPHLSIHSLQSLSLPSVHHAIGDILTAVSLEKGLRN